MILKILVETYIAYRRSLGEKFVTNARELQMFVNYAGLKCDVCTIDRSLCESFLLHPKGKVTANWFCKHTALKGFFQWAVVRGYIAKSPFFRAVRNISAPTSTPMMSSAPSSAAP